MALAPGPGQGRPPSPGGPAKLKNLDRVQTELLAYLRETGRLSLDRKYLAAARRSVAGSVSEPWLEEEISLSPGELVSALMAPLSVIAEACEQLMARIKKASDQPVIRQLHENPWPPTDGRVYITSDAFGLLLLELVEWFVERYIHMDFSTALARHVFVWFDGKLAKDPNFLEPRPGFKTPGAFVASVTGRLERRTVDPARAPAR